MKRWVLWFARVPAEPEPPQGSPGSIRVFRAAPNFWKFLIVRWGLKQISGAAALAFFLSLTAGWEASLAAAKADATNKPRTRRDWFRSQQHTVAGWVHGFELLGLGFFVLQVPLSLAAARLDYEMRWYMVTDRSMRLREGVFRVREMTLTFANVQNITIRQGPLQRFLGISDVVVRTAGGGGSEGHDSHEASHDSMHTGVLRAVDNPEHVRDLILDRLKHLRDAGLGDPDDHHPPSHEATLAAARDLVEAIASVRGYLKA